MNRLPPVTFLTRPWGLAGLALVLLAGCQSRPDRESASPSADDGSTAVSFYERRLLEVIELDQALVAEAFTEDGPVDDLRIQRRFQAIAADYAAIVADNPAELDARLLYGKFLGRFGDRRGAHEQFSIVWRRNPDIAVANQQLGAYLAEEGQFVDALGFYLRAVELEPDQAAYHYDVGELLATFRPGFVDQGVLPATQLEADMLRAFAEAARLAPNDLRLQMRYGEAFYDTLSPDWGTALRHWETVAARTDLSPLERDAVTLHQARTLVELGRTTEAIALAQQVQSPGLAASRDEVLDAAGR